MYRKILDGATIVIAIGVVALCFAVFTGGTAKLSGGNGGTSHWGGAIDAAGGFDVGGTEIANSSGQIDGNIVQGATAVNVMLGTTVLNQLVQAAGGWSSTITGSTTITSAQFCGSTALYIPATATSSFTITFPAAAATYLTCGSPALGSFSPQIIVNDSTQTITFAAGTGMRLLYPTTGMGTTTFATASKTLLGSSTYYATGEWVGTSSIYIFGGPMFY